MKIIDVSHYQGNIDFSRVKSDGYSGVIQKCTESTSFKDDTFESNRTAIRKAGLLFGAYHFARGGDAEKEAKYFCDNIGELLDGEFVVIDYEIKTLKDPATWCLKFSNYVEKALGVKPLLYTYHSLLNTYNWTTLSNNGNKLWAARYGLQEQEPNYDYQPSTGSFGSYVLWQYSNIGSVDGITVNVDLNYTKLSLTEFKKLVCKYSSEITTTTEQEESTLGKLIIIKQGDAEWADDTIGTTDVKLEDSGCTITCLSILSYWYGDYKKPSWIAKNLKFTDNAKVYWASINGKLPMNFVYRYYSRNDSKIKEIIASADNACILEVNNKSHWVVAIGYSRLYGYKIIDPYYGDMIYLNKRYKNITGFAEVTRA